MNFNLKWVLSHKQWFDCLDPCPRNRPGCASFPVAGQTTIGVDANQAIPGDIVERHRANARDLQLLRLGLSKQTKMGQTRAGRQHDRKLHESSASPILAR